MKRSASNTHLSNREAPPVEKKQRKEFQIIGDLEWYEEEKYLIDRDIQSLILMDVTCTNIKENSLPHSLESLEVVSSDSSCFTSLSFPNSLKQLKWTFRHRNHHHSVDFEFPRDKTSFAIIIPMLKNIQEKERIMITTMEEWKLLPECIALVSNDQIEIEITIPMFNEKFDGEWMSQVSSVIIHSKLFNNNSIIRNKFAQNHLVKLRIAPNQSKSTFCQRWTHSFQKLKQVTIAKETFLLPKQWSALNLELEIRHQALSENSKLTTIKFSLDSSNYSPSILLKPQQYGLILNEVNLILDTLTSSLPKTVKRLSWVCDKQCILDTSHPWLGDGLESVYFKKSPIVIRERRTWNNGLDGFTSYDIKELKNMENTKTIPIYEPFHLSYLPSTCQTVIIGDKTFHLYNEKQRLYCSKQFRDDFFHAQDILDETQTAFWSNRYAYDLYTTIEQESNTIVVKEKNRDKQIDQLQFLDSTNYEYIGIRGGLNFNVVFDQIVHNERFFDKELHKKVQNKFDEEKRNPSLDGVIWYSPYKGKIMWNLLSYGVPSQYRSTFKEEQTIDLFNERRLQKFLLSPTGQYKMMIYSLHQSELKSQDESGTEQLQQKQKHKHEEQKQQQQKQQTILEVPDSVQWIKIRTFKFPYLKISPNSQLHTVEFGSKYIHKTRWRTPFERDSLFFHDEDGNVVLPSCVREIVFSNQKSKMSLFFINEEDHNLLKQTLSMRIQVHDTGSLKTTLETYNQLLIGNYFTFHTLYLEGYSHLITANLLPPTLKYLRTRTVSSEVFHSLPPTIQEIHTTGGSFDGCNTENLQVFLYADQTYRDCMQFDLGGNKYSISLLRSKSNTNNSSSSSSSINTVNNSNSSYNNFLSGDDSPKIEKYDAVDHNSGKFEFSKAKLHFVLYGQESLKKYMTQISSEKWIINSEQEWTIFKNFGVLCHPRSISITYSEFSEPLLKSMFLYTETLDLSSTNFNHPSIWNKNVFGHNMRIISLPPNFSIPLPLDWEKQFQLSFMFEQIRLLKNNGQWQVFQIQKQLEIERLRNILLEKSSSMKLTK